MLFSITRRGGRMNRQSTKKALLIPFILMVLTAIALVVVWFIFNQLVAGIATAILFSGLTVHSSTSNHFLIIIFLLFSLN
jgi:c-di-AMP phosphodiesterase-like protein